MNKIFRAPGPNELAQKPLGDANLAGFWKGVWHGATTPITFFISLFNPNVNIYEVRNDGRWYNFGYVIGLSIAFGGGKGSTKIRVQKAKNIEKRSA